MVADETRDISNDEQMTVMICWVDLQYTVHEDFIGVIHVPDATSAILPLSKMQCLSGLYLNFIFADFATF